MTRIVRRNREDRWVVLILEGHIVTEWASILEEECQDLMRSGLRVVLDLSGVLFISRSGVAALKRLGRSGIEIKGSSPLIADMLAEEGIKVTRKKEDMDDRIVPWKRKSGSDA